MLRRPVTLCEYMFFVSAALFAQRKPKSPTVPFPRLGSPTAGQGKGIVLECSCRECSQTQFIDRCNFVRSSVKVRTPTLCARLLVHLIRHPETRLWSNPKSPSVCTSAVVWRMSFELPLLSL